MNKKYWLQNETDLEIEQLQKFVLDHNVFIKNIENDLFDIEQTNKKILLKVQKQEDENEKLRIKVQDQEDIIEAILEHLGVKAEPETFWRSSSGDIDTYIERMLKKGCKEDRLFVKGFKLINTDFKRKTYKDYQDSINKVLKCLKKED